MVYYVGNLLLSALVTTSFLFNKPYGVCVCVSLATVDEMCINLNCKQLSTNICMSNVVKHDFQRRSFHIEHEVKKKQLSDTVTLNNIIRLMSALQT